MLIIVTSIQGEHLIKKSEFYTIKNTETNQLSSISGETLIKQLVADKKAKRPYRYTNAKSTGLFIMYNEVSLCSATISIKGLHSFNPINSSSVKCIKINDDNVIFLVNLLNSGFITISVKKPELYDRNLGILSVRIGTHRESFSMNIGRDFQFHFSNLVQKGDVITSDLIVYYVSSEGRNLSVSLGNIKVSKYDIKYKNEIMPYITEEVISKYILSGRIKDLLP